MVNMIPHPYYNVVTHELDNKGIIKDIKIAGEFYKRGNIEECYNILYEIVFALQLRIKNNYKED